MTNEFKHYDGCKHKNPASCSACALTDTTQDAPNYAAWPLVYMENNRAIPAKWFNAFVAELNSDNQGYAANVRRTMEARGVRFAP
jgi:hypothetical protein